MSPDQTQQTANLSVRRCNVPKTDGLGGMVMNAECGSVKTVRAGTAKSAAAPKALSKEDHRCHDVDASVIPARRSA